MPDSTEAQRRAEFHFPDAGDVDLAVEVAGCEARDVLVRARVDGLRVLPPLGEVGVRLPGPVEVVNPLWAGRGHHLVQPAFPAHEVASNGACPRSIPFTIMSSGRTACA